MNFDFNESYILENEFVCLKPLVSNDFEHLLPFSLNEPEIWKYSLQSATGEENLTYYINQAIQAKKNKTDYPFIVYDKRKNAYVGSTRFYDIQLENKCLSIGYTWYGKAFQGTGLNNHCKYLLLNFAFENLKMERVELRADLENKRSIAAMIKVGCTQEGILRSNGIKADGMRRDSIIFSILKSEWDLHVKNQLAKNFSLI